LEQYLDNNLIKMHGVNNNVKFKYISMNLIIQEIISSNFQANNKARTACSIRIFIRGGSLLKRLHS